MFTYYTIIGRDPVLFKSHIDNIKNHAGFDMMMCDKEILAIVYVNDSISTNITDSIISICDEESIRYHIYKEPSPDFLSNLYTCWNLGYEHAKDGWVFRGGSDQVFSENSFSSLYEIAEEMSKGDSKFILQANTIENQEMIASIGANSRHILKNFGNNFQEFDYRSFDSFCGELRASTDLGILDWRQALDVWGKPRELYTSLGVQYRCDGCSWLMKRDDWTKYGPLPPIERGVTGDVIIHDRLQLAGFRNYIVRDCITYHFVRGESKHVY